MDAVSSPGSDVRAADMDALLRTSLGLRRHMGGNSFAFLAQQPASRIPPSFPPSLHPSFLLLLSFLVLLLFVQLPDLGTRQRNEFLELAIKLAFACPLIPFG